MVSIKGLEQGRLSQPDYNVYYVRRPQGQKLLEYFDDKNRCFPLLGSAARYNGNGHIFWIEYGDLKKERAVLLDQCYAQVSKPDSRAQLGAARTLYQDSKGLRIYHFLSVEDAIRSVRNHILPAERGKEIHQVEAAQSWIGELLNFYCSGNFANIPPNEFTEVEDLTLAILEEIGIRDPHNLVNRLKERGFSWLRKGGSGKDSTGRENYVVTKQTLGAALRRMKSRETAIRGPIVHKYELIHAALESTRYIDRRILEEAEKELRTMSEIVVFKRPGKIHEEGTVSPTVAKLDDLVDMLKLPLLDPYHSRGKYASTDLQAVRDGLIAKRKVTVADVALLSKVRDWIKWDLDRGITF